MLMDDDILDERPDELAVNPSLAADASLRLEQARQALLKLPENLRSAFVLYEVNGLRYREIAQTLGIPINTVKIHITRARERLSKLITREESTIHNGGNVNKEPRSPSPIGTGRADGERGEMSKDFRRRVKKLWTKTCNS